MANIQNLSRRGVIKGAAVASGLVLGFHLGFRHFPQAEAARTWPFQPNVYLAIDETGLVSIMAHRSEMGTGIKTDLPLIVADELEADWKRVKVVQAEGDARYGDQNTDGSRSTWQFYQAMREAGAAARQMLEAAAGKIMEDHLLVNEYVIQQDQNKQLVFYWYQGRGRVIASEYWGKFWMVADAISRDRTDSALIRLNTSMDDDETEARSRLVSFTQLLFAYLDQLIPN